MSFKELLAQHPEYRSGVAMVKLVLVRGCRNVEDSACIDGLRKMAKEFGIEVRSSLIPLTPRAGLNPEMSEYRLTCSLC